MTPVIRTRGLSKRFGHNQALASLDLEVPAGTIFGYLGPNGAGKSTTIRILTGLIRPTSGSAEILGHDVVTDRSGVLADLGYLPGDFAGYRDLTADQYLTYLANLRGDVERSDIDVLAKRFDLPLDRRIGTLSHGNRQKVGLVQAFMHQPQVLILDEPTQGLDPLVQREFLGLVREVCDAGRTVFLSSHVLAEVEAVADLVGIIRHGRLVVTSDVAELKARTRRRIQLWFAGDPSDAIGALSRVPGVHELEVVDGVVELTVEGSMAELFVAAAPYRIDRVVSNEVDLEGVFLQYYEDEER